MLQEKLPLEGVVEAPLQMMLESPERLSLAEPDRTREEEVKTVPSEGEFIVKAGMVLSMLRVTLAVAVSPLASVAVRPTTWLTPSVEMVCGAGQLVTGELPAWQVAVTVTLLLFHPLALGLGDTERVIVGGVPVTTTKLNPLLATPPTVTTTLPVAAPAGTGTMIELVPQVVGVAAVPLKVTVLVPWLDPKLFPFMFTEVPPAPLVGDRLVMFGTTMKFSPLLEVPLTVTTKLPLVAPEGTVVTIDVGLQPVAVTAVPLKVTVLAPCVVPKFVPPIVTDAPTGPELGDKLVTLGPVPGTVKLTPLLTVPLAVTTTLPVVALAGTGTLIWVALQLVGTPETPLKLTVFVPCVEPKPVPLIVTDVATAPDAGEMLVMFGAAVPTSKP
jgi:hypothetical protein